jgi:hypothetical protein
MKKAQPTLIVCLVALAACLGLASEPLFAWGKPILVAQDNRYSYEKPQVKYSPGGVAYVSYTARTIGSSTANVFLSRYDGNSVSFVRSVSETSQHAYEGDVGISATGQIHVAWAEHNLSNPNTQYIRYRSSSNGTSWSSIQTLTTVTSSDLIEDLRLAVDGSNNVFVVFMVWPEARCRIITKYGSSVSTQNFPVAGRSKHPDVAADSRFIYIAWQHMDGGDYTIMTQRRNNSAGGSWLPAVDLKVTQAQKPRTDPDDGRNQQLVYWIKDTTSSRKLLHRRWLGSSYSAAKVISDPDDYLTYHYADFEVAGKHMIATMQLGGYLGGRALYYNWGSDGTWGGIQTVPGTGSLSPAQASVDLTSSGKAVIALASRDDAVYLITSDGDVVDPEPPVTNLPPSAKFTMNPLGGLYPLNVTFNASPSKDPDGQIVSYDWDFDDGGGAASMIVQHVFQAKKRYIITLTVTDNLGATATATGEVEVFGLYPPLNVSYTRYENRNLFSIEYLYRITWRHNPANDEVGAKIVAYKIYRRERGASYEPGLFHTFSAGNMNEFEYLDRTIGQAAKEYEYRVSSVDSQGRESDLN